MDTEITKSTSNLDEQASCGIAWGNSNTILNNHCPGADICIHVEDEEGNQVIEALIQNLRMAGCKIRPLPVNPGYTILANCPDGNCNTLLAISYYLFSSEKTEGEVS